LDDITSNVTVINSSEPNLSTKAIVTPDQPVAPRIRASDPPLHVPTPQTGPAISEDMSSLDDDAMERLRAANTVEPIPRSFFARDAYALLSLLDASNNSTDDTYVLKSYAEAMRRPDLWELAMRDKLQMMSDRDVFIIVPELSVPAGKKVIGCCWVYATKYNGEGNIVQ
ncbi:hypothetical protein C0993_000507, partial [Termitomyces sp. T159_Od127]